MVQPQGGGGKEGEGASNWRGDHVCPAVRGPSTMKRTGCWKARSSEGLLESLVLFILLERSVCLLTLYLFIRIRMITKSL